MANGGIIGTVNNPTSTTATGVWQQQEQYEAKVTDTWPQRALFTTKSLRFNPASSDYLNRTPSSVGNRKTATFSCWIKRSLITSGQTLFWSGSDNSNYIAFIRFLADDRLLVAEINSGSTTWEIITNKVFRDISAWYHIVVAMDTTQGTAANRVKIYVNGVQETSLNIDGGYPGQNRDTLINTAVPHQIGHDYVAQYYGGYTAETIFIDGQALAPTSFGSTNSDGVWIPAIYTGTYGTNGFNLQFENAAALGTDSSPNGNTFTVNNLTSIDQSTDYPEVNFCTWNPLRFWNRSGTLQKVSFDNGNLRAIFDDTGYNEYAFASIGVDTGKWFCEMKAEDVTATANTRIGVLNMDYTGTGNPGDQSTSVSYMANGQKRVGGSNSSYGASYTNGDIIGVALDVTNNTVTFYKNGASQGAISITANTLYTFYSEDYASSGNKEIQANFGSPAYAISSGNADGNGYGNFEYAVPSGYYSLNTKNLAEFG